MYVPRREEDEKKNTIIIIEKRQRFQQPKSKRLIRQSHLQTPALSHTFDHSDNNSEADWCAYPVTPLSMGSP